MHPIPSVSWLIAAAIGVSAVPPLLAPRVAAAEVPTAAVAVGLTSVETTAHGVVQGTITGRVTSTQTGEPIAGATVRVIGTQMSAVSGPDGRFTIAGVPAGTHQVAVSAPGYGMRVAEGVRIATGQTQTLNFQLASQAAVELEGVVAVGYGTQRRRDVTGAVGSIRAEELEKVQAPTVAQALQGRVAGVQVTQGSSAPGGGVSVRIRGSGSLGSGNEPLYVVDGVPISGADTNNPNSGGRRVSMNPLAFLNPEDIESIEVLKDASSTAIYGARGTNGVVLITTRKGRSGTSRLEFESSVATQQVAKTIPVLNGPQFAEFVNEFARLDGRSTVPFPDPASVSSTDWQSLIYRAAPMHEHSISALGGTDQTRFAVSASLADQQGVVRGSEFQRYSLRANVTHDVSRVLTLGSNINLSRINGSQGFTSGSGESATRQAGAVLGSLVAYPIMPVRNERGEYTWNDKDTPGAIEALGVVGSSYENPVAAVNEITDEAEYDRVLGNLSADLNLAEGLTFRLNGAANLVNNSRNEYYNRASRIGGEAGLGGRALRGVVEQSHYLAEAILNYQRSFATAHDLDFTTGATYEREERFGELISNSNFPNDITRFYNIGAGAPEGGPQIQSNFVDWTLLSYLGRVNYSLNQRYLLTLTGRADGSSKFGADNKWGFFPSAAVAWRASEEPFLQDVEWLSDLKLRVSYGQTGNQEIGSYGSLARVRDTNYNWNGQIVPAYQPVSVANRELRWEKSTQIDAGFDAGFLDNRFSLSFDIYDKLTDDLLLHVPLPYWTGFTSALQNLGNVRNRGVELSLSGLLLEGFDGRPSWRTSFNLGANRNTVLEIGDRDEIIGGAISGAHQIGGLLVREGLPMGVFYGYQTSGIFRNAAEVAAHVGSNGALIQPGAVPGQLRFVDQNGDGRITQDDRTVLGNPEPGFTVGWSNDLAWGSFSLYTFLQGTQGNEVYNANLEQIAIGGNITTNSYAPRILGAWRPENPDADWPIVHLPAGVGYNGPGTGVADLTDLFIEDGSYLRLRAMTLSYDVPETWARRIGGMSTARISLSGENLFTWTSYRGFNPDVNATGQHNINRGIDFNSYPLARVYRLGIRFGL